MGMYDDITRLMVAVHKYHSTGDVPDDAEELDQVCAQVLEVNPFDETGIDWKRISEYVKEINGGDWPETIEG